MSLWSNKDTVYATGNIITIAIINGDGVITGNGTDWTSENDIVPGLVITLGSKGSGVIKSVDSITQLTLVGDTGLTAEVGLTETYNISEQPTYLPVDSNWDGNEIYGVDTSEQSAARTAGSQYKPAHAGWVGITTYVDMHDSLRVKSEVLVASSTITSDSADADDDTILPDS